jgi:hypothetical protein
VHCDGPTLQQLADERGYPLATPPARLDAVSLGSSLGFQRVETLDIAGGASLQLNLHDEPPAELVDGFDCVIDAGVLFWCSDPGAALRTILRMARVGGVIAHITAVSGHYGRGYWDVHPRLFEDFYLRNGCEFIESSVRTKFRARGVTDRVAAQLGLRENTTSVTREPGNVYLAESRPTRIAFARRQSHRGEPNMIPNNVVGLFVFRKLREVPITMPVPVSCPCAAASPACLTARRPSRSRVPSSRRTSTSTTSRRTARSPTTR